MLALLSFAIALLHSLRACFRSQSEQALVELALRQQLAVLAQAGRRPRLTSLDRAFWVLLRQLWPRWREVLVVVQPETVVRWHRKGFRLYWRFRSRRRPGRPRIPKEVRQLIRRMALENPWGARKIHAELAKLGIEVSLGDRLALPPEAATGSGAATELADVPAESQGCHRGDGLLRRPDRALPALVRLVRPRPRPETSDSLQRHDEPTASWVTQQLREAFPSDDALPFLLYDRDSIFSAEVTATIRNLGIEPITNGVPQSLAEPVRRAMGRNLSARAARSRRRPRRTAPPATACRLRLLLQCRAGPHAPGRFTRWAPQRSPALAERKGGRPPSRARPPPSVRMVQSSLTPWPSAYRRHAMSSEDRQAVQENAHSGPEPGYPRAGCLFRRARRRNPAAQRFASAGGLRSPERRPSPVFLSALTSPHRSSDPSTPGTADGGSRRPRGRCA